jgi:GntR family transcriptional regulator, transcriptional repressor for pyruvate dehydrogenase complex
MAGRRRGALLTDSIRSRPIRRAYEQVYDQLLEGMLSGSIANDQRFPTEAELATTFGVSRSTIRDALRMLHAEGLIRTVKGAHGGSFATLPTVGYVSDFMRRNLELLSRRDDVTLDEFLEARRLIEVFAVRTAASRRSTEDIAALKATLDEGAPPLSPEEQYVHNREFHVTLVDACGNSLLRIAALPIFAVLHTHLERSTLSPEFSQQVRDEHGPILDAISRGDADAAEQLMLDHLEWLSTIYRDIWRKGR